MSPSAPSGLTFKGPIYQNAGYASAARQFFWALHGETSTPALHLQSLRWNSGTLTDLPRDMYLQLKAYEKAPVSPDYALLHWSIASEFEGRGPYSTAIGHTIFETHSLLKSFVVGCNRMDHLIVPTAFHQQAFTNAGVTTPIHVVPEGVDTERFQPIGPTLEHVPERFTFLFVAQVSYRKSIDLVLEAFLELFQQHEDVQLVLRCYLRDGGPEDQAEIKKIVQVFREKKNWSGGNILLLDNVPEQHLPAMYRSAHVLLAPFRGEGWGLPIIEAQACEVPVIVTGWGGPMAYLTEETAYLLPFELRPIPSDIPDYFLGSAMQAAREEGHLLAEPALDALKYTMWDAYKNYFLHKARATAARDHVHRNFRWQHAAQKFMHEVWPLLKNR